MQETKTMTLSRSTRSLTRRLLGWVVLAALLGTAGVAWGQDQRCGWGEVEAVLQAGPVGYINATDFLTRPRRAGVGGGVERCQFRVFDDGQTYVFKAGDFVFGGVTWLFDYPNWGFTLAEAIDDLEATEDRIWFGPSGGELVEQDLEQSAYKQFHRPDWGLTLYQNRGFIAQLEPGEYTCHWESTYYGAPLASATLYIVVPSD